MSASHELGDDDIELSVTLSGTPSARLLSWRGWKTRPWIRLLSGTLSRPSMADRGVERWISSLLASRVSPGRVPESDRVDLTYAGFGLRYYGWSLRSALPLYSWRTALAWTKEQCAALFDDLAMAPDLFEPALRTSAHPTVESGGSAWPTPTATDAKASGAAGYSTDSGRHSGTTLTDRAVRMWPTPTAQDYGYNQGGAAGRTGPKRPSLRALTATGRSGMVLNPRFVERLMGYQDSWTHPLIELIDSELWGTPLSHSKPSMRFDVSSRREGEGDES